MLREGLSSSSSPSFLVIGAQKAGTTWFYTNLRAHPHVWLPREKELHYFDEKRDRSRSIVTNLFGRDARSRRWRRQLNHQTRELVEDFSLDDLKWSARYLFRAPSDMWYLSLFDRAAGRVTGEMTPAYSTLTPERVEGLSRLLPDAKIIFFLRHPIERAWSQAVMENRQQGTDPARADLSTLENPSSMLRTNYMRTIDIWSAFFSPSRLFVAFLEDVSFRPDEVLQRITRFLGLPEFSQWPYLRRRIFQAPTSAMPAVAGRRLAELYADLVEELARRFGGHAEWWQYSTTRLRAEDAGGVLHYPLTAGALWHDWLDQRDDAAGWESGVPPCQSGTLEALTSGPLGRGRAGGER